jgi:hypothetical protein
VLAADPAVPSPANVLLTCATMTSTPESHQVRAAANEVVELKGRVRWGACAIVTSTDMLYGMSRVFAVFSQDAFGESRVFRELVEAEVWLAARKIRV